MKKYIAKSISLAALIGCASVMFSSCEDTLDADKYFDDRRTLESVFTDINQTNNWLSQSFAFLKDDLCDVTTKENSGRAFHVFADDVFWGDRDAMLGAGYNARTHMLRSSRATIMRITAHNTGSTHIAVFSRRRCSSTTSIVTTNFPKNSALI